MITPSFSLTATERVLPKLALDFTTASLDPRVTFTRTTGASNPATYVASTGYITAATNDQPRFDYNPITLACKGLLIEESRANLCTYSEDYTNPVYTFTDISIGSNQTAAPDNTNTADLWTQGTAGTAVSYRTAGITVSAGATISYSVFAKRSASMQWLRIRLSNNANTNGGTAWFDLTNGVLGTVSNAGTGTNTSATITPFANGFYRLTITTKIDAADILANRYVFATTADNTTTRQSNATWYMWGEQLEVGAFPTSYIPTTIIALTRNADVATMTGTNFSSWFNASEGAFETVSVLPYTIPSGQFPCLFQIAGTAGNTQSIYQFLSAGNNRFSYDGTASGAGQWSAGSASSTFNVAANVTAKYCGAYKANSIAGAVNGVSPVTDSSATIPTVTTATIGSVGGTSQFWNGYVQKIYYWPQRLINNEVQAFSK